LIAGCYWFFTFCYFSRRFFNFNYRLWSSNNFNNWLWFWNYNWLWLCWSRNNLYNRRGFSLSGGFPTDWGFLV
jgi:hypothetical protein